MIFGGGLGIGKIIMLIVVILIVVAIIYFVAAYFMGIWPFAPASGSNDTTQ